MHHGQLAAHARRWCWWTSRQRYPSGNNSRSSVKKKNRLFPTGYWLRLHKMCVAHGLSAKTVGYVPFTHSFLAEFNTFSVVNVGTGSAPSKRNRHVAEFR